MPYYLYLTRLDLCAPGFGAVGVQQLRQLTDGHSHSQEIFLCFVKLVCVLLNQNVKWLCNLAAILTAHVSGLYNNCDLATDTVPITFQRHTLPTTRHRQ